MSRMSDLDCEIRAAAVPGREVRAYSACELRAEDGEKPKLIGYAAKFGKPSQRLWGWDGGFVEFIERGAFKKTLARGDDVRALKNHDSNLIFARSTNDTLKMSEDEVGLRVEISPPDTQTSRSVIEDVRAGLLTQMSFAFEMISERVDHPKEKGESITRTLLEVNLFDVSVVAYPAYVDTEIAVRSIALAVRGAGFEGWESAARERQLRLLELAS